MDVEGSNPFARSIFFMLLVIKSSELFSLPKSLQIFREFFSTEVSPWEWVGKIAEALGSDVFRELEKPEIKASRGLHIEGEVYIDPSVKLPPYGFIQGPVYIGANTELRAGVYVRSHVIVGEGCVLGNSCEYKNALLMDRVQTPHFNYVGDSVLGSESHLGAGVILANVRLDKKSVAIRIGEERIETAFKKLGTILGEGAEVGCNAVLQPGTILGKGSIVGPTRAFGGYLESGERFV